MQSENQIEAEETGWFYEEAAEEEAAEEEAALSHLFEIEIE
jgi:hypothetical protein